MFTLLPEAACSPVPRGLRRWPHQDSGEHRARSCSRSGVVRRRPVSVSAATGAGTCARCPRHVGAHPGVVQRVPVRGPTPTPSCGVPRACRPPLRFPGLPVPAQSPGAGLAPNACAGPREALGSGDKGHHLPASSIRATASACPPFSKARGPGRLRRARPRPPDTGPGGARPPSPSAQVPGAPGPRDPAGRAPRARRTYLRRQGEGGAGRVPTRAPRARGLTAGSPGAGVSPRGPSAQAVQPGAGSSSLLSRPARGASSFWATSLAHPGRPRTSSRPPPPAPRAPREPGAGPGRGGLGDGRGRAPRPRGPGTAASVHDVRTAARSPPFGGRRPGHALPSPRSSSGASVPLCAVLNPRHRDRTGPC